MKQGAENKGIEGAEGGEEALVRAWAAVGALRDTLTTQEGEQLRVVSPGVRNGGPGPDFLRAVLCAERGRLVRGDVELHRATSAWKLHGHGRDPGYDRVVLHVVGRDDEGLPTQLSSGARVPVLVLSGPVLEQGREPSLSCCPKGGEMRAGVGLAGVLEAQGWLRFQARVRRWARLLGRGQQDQLLYQAVMEGLGYQQNRAPFLRLALALPFLGAWWQRAGDTRRWQAVADLYGSYPALEADNVVRRMTGALGLQGQRLRGCQQQGLHHLFQRYCLRARHGVCPVGRLTAGALAEAEAGEDV